MKEKYGLLVAALKDMGGVAVAFSGGVDSAFLLAAAKEALGDRALAVIGRSPTYPKRELDDAVQLAGQLGVKCKVVETHELDNPRFQANPHDRCAMCKGELISTVRAVADQEGLEQVLEGSNADDVGDYRPGMEASAKLGARMPLKELGFTKKEIRTLSKEMGLPTWNKPAAACLSSRIPYGDEINVPKLNRIEQAENAIRNMGIGQLRVRDHGQVARIEVDKEDISSLLEPDLRARLVAALKQVGYQYVCLDLEGYRTGAMNEVL